MQRPQLVGEAARSMIGSTTQYVRPLQGALLQRPLLAREAARGVKSPPRRTALHGPNDAASSPRWHSPRVRVSREPTDLGEQGW